MHVTIGAFQLRKRLGKGGMGEVWAATHLEDGVQVALKLMTSDRAKDARYQEAFRREVRAVASLDHAAIIQVLDCGEVSSSASQASGGTIAAGSPYLVMELAQGTLRDVASHLSLWSQHRTVLLRVLDGLAHAHARGVIHRDLKPENVLLVPGPDGPTLKLADFGLAHAYNDPDDTEGDAVIGTPRFMAPEQILGDWRAHGPWTDLYAVGCLAYWLASGKPPYSSNKTEEILQAHLRGSLPPLKTERELPDEFSLWLERMMARRTGDRFQLAADAAFALQSLDTRAASVAMPALPHAQTADHADPDEETLLLSRTLTLPAFDGQDRELPPGNMLGGLPARPPVPDTWEEGRGPSHNTASDHLRGVGLGLYGLRQLRLVDRQDERDVLWDALRLVIATGEPMALALTGTMGVGKTRLADWLGERAMELGAALPIQVRHSPIEGTGQGLVRLVTNRLRTHGMSRDAIVDRLRAFLEDKQDLGPDDLHDCLALAELVAPYCDPSYDPENARVVFSSPRERYALATRFLRFCARRRPHILLLDDVHWGQDTLDFVHFLLTESPADLPILVIMTLRDEALEERPQERVAFSSLQELDAFEALEITPLPERDHQELVQTLLGLDSELAEDVVRRTRGNPLFAVQLVGDWVERGILEPTASGFRLRSGASARLPDDIDHLLRGRIDELARRLPPPDEVVWSALEIAAALGSEVDLKEWHAACERSGVPIPPELLDSLVLARLAQAEVFRFSFLHGAIRECLHRHAESAGRWEAHHQACAQALTDIYLAQTPGMASRIGRHLLQAREHRAALPHLLRGADEARIASEFSAALELLDLHLDALAHVPLEERQELRAQGQIHRARLLLKANRVAEAEAILNDIPEDLPPEVRAQELFARGVLLRTKGNIQDGLAVARACAQAYDTLDYGVSTGHAKAYTLLGDLLQSAGHLQEAEASARQSLQLARGDLNDLASAQLQLGSVLNARGIPEEAIYWITKSRSAYEIAGNRYGVAQAENNLGEVYRINDQLQEAALHYKEALRGLHRLGITSQTTVRFNLGICLAQSGNIRDAEPYFRAVHEALVVAQATGYLSMSNLALMACAGARGDWISWTTHLGEAQRCLDESGIVIPDIAVLAELSMPIAEAAGLFDDHDTLGAIASAQWTKLRPQS